MTASDWLDFDQWFMVGPLFAFLSVGTLEYLVTWRTPGTMLGARWIANFTLIAINSTFPYLLLPTGVVGMAAYSEGLGLGVLPRLGLPSWFGLAAGVLFLDLFSYLLHRLSHIVPLLWRVHAVHHADPEVDATTGFRHHPGEIVFTTVSILAAIFLLGIPTSAVVIYISIASFFQIAQHANTAVPSALDRVLRHAVITPDVHRIHHSQDPVEGNRNFGQVLICWDRLFGTYLPRANDSELLFGLDGFSGRADLAPWRVLAMPLRSAEFAAPPRRSRAG